MQIGCICFVAITKKLLITQEFLSLVRRKGLEPSQDKLPLEPESSASAIPPSPLADKKYNITFWQIMQMFFCIILKKYANFYLHSIAKRNAILFIPCLMDFNSIDFQMFINRNNETFPSVNFSGFNEIRPLRVYFQNNIRSFNLESLCACNIGGK